LNYLAEVAHQQYKSMDAKEVKDQGTYIEIPLEIALTADYHNLGRYINMIERSKRFAKVDQLEIAYDFENPDQQTVKLVVSTFMFVKKSAAPAEAAPSATTRS
jgi:Tfp pilus assembly protein PilO